MIADLGLRGGAAQADLRKLAFRDSYAHVLHHRPASSWRNWDSDFHGIQIDTGAQAERRFEAWKAGETGFPFVDAGTRQLRQTGFMHKGADDRCGDYIRRWGPELHPPGGAHLSKGERPDA
jgi:deoxyribodipyrimidine photo-lyase